MMGKGTKRRDVCKMGSGKEGETRGMHVLYILSFLVCLKVVGCGRGRIKTGEE